MKKSIIMLFLLLLFGSVIPLGFCTGEFKEFFNELLFGSGQVFGAILIVTFCVLISLKWKEIGILFIIPLVIMFYMTSASVNWSNMTAFTQNVWIWVFYILGALFIFLRWVGILGD